MSADNQKYFSTRKPFARVRHKHLLFRIALSVFKAVTPKTHIEYSAPLPEDEPIVVLANHSRDYGPIAFLTAYTRKNRMWSTPNLCFVKKVPNHIMYSFYPNAKGFPAKLLRIASFIVAPFFPPLFCALEVIPAYQSLRAVETFKKTIATLKEGYDVIIFPETEVKSDFHRFVNKLNGGFLRLASAYYKETGKVLKFYPAYTAKSIRTLKIGLPITINPLIPDKPQFTATKHAIMDEIERLGNSLPPHTLTPFGDPVVAPERIKKYIDEDKYSLKDARKYTKEIERYEESKNKIRT